MNKEAFNQLADVIELHERNFDLNSFVRKPYESGGGYDRIVGEEVQCGTTMCVAGWATWLANGKSVSVAQSPQYYKQTAEAFLGITGDQGNHLFYAERGSVWSRCASLFDWDVHIDDDDYRTGDLAGWEQIEAHQAAKVLRMIANEEVTL